MKINIRICVYLDLIEYDINKKPQQNVLQFARSKMNILRGVYLFVAQNHLSNELSSHPL